MESIKASLDPENRDVTLGMIIEKLDSMKEQNDEDHQKIFARLDEGDQYFAVFKVSRCLLTWLDHQGAVKYFLLIVCFFLADWISRYLYWDIFPKP
jgi:hypothetical protein